MEDRIDRRSTEEIRFSDNQFNLAFEFVQYAPSRESGRPKSGQFKSKVIPENVAVLEAHVVKENNDLEWKSISRISSFTTGDDLIPVVVLDRGSCRPSATQFFSLLCLKTPDRPTTFIPRRLSLESVPVFASRPGVPIVMPNDSFDEWLIVLFCKFCFLTFLAPLKASC